MKKLVVIIFLCLNQFVYATDGGKTKIVLPQEHQYLLSENTQQQPNINNFEENPSLKNYPETNFQKTFIRMLITLGVIIILIFISFWAFRRIIRNRYQSSGTSKKIKIIEKKILSPKSMLYLVEIEDKQVLLSESHLEVRPIISDSIEVHSHHHIEDDE